jgi:pyruvate/2-oxoglutarate dehydrogenase complex dihydrolipoamide dehydrogenase (E3) component
MKQYDVVVIGGGPAGLASATSASKAGAKVLLLEREGKLGGILKQCIHDGFGVTRFGEKLSGPEYAYKETEAFLKTGAEYSLLSFVTSLKRNPDASFSLSYVCPEGVKEITSSKLILATGCRERSSRGVMITGTNPAGVMTAGQCQYYMNILGEMPVKNAVILGSGDIGLIMARRISLEGGHVIGVYEAKSSPSGLARNIAQCLDDFNIPLHLSTTVTEAHGVDCLSSVTIAKVDEHMNPVKGTEEEIPCDSLILSVGLIPENELAKKLSVPLSMRTKGPECDQSFETLVPSVYTCGNAMHVNDLADFVSESGEIAGVNAANKNVLTPLYEKVEMDKHFGYVVPTNVNFAKPTTKMTFYFRVRDIYRNVVLKVKQGDKVILTRPYSILKPPEMQKLLITLVDKAPLSFVLEEKL